MPAPPDEQGRRPRQDADPRSARRQARRHPQYPRCASVRTAQTFGLKPRELNIHALELLANGWGVWEIRAVLALPATESLR